MDACCRNRHLSSRGMERLLTARDAAIEGGASISLLLVVADFRGFAAGPTYKIRFIAARRQLLNTISPFSRVRRNTAGEQSKGIGQVDQAVTQPDEVSPPGSRPV
jgi:hypothetical protein